jgi:DNA-directed RNA polymerase subunit RPC12/RpoP
MAMRSEVAQVRPHRGRSVEKAVESFAGMTHVPKCLECGREQSAGERGWSAYLTTDEDEPAEAVVYCPDCAAREFGERDSG